MSVVMPGLLVIQIQIHAMCGTNKLNLLRRSFFTFDHHQVTYCMNCIRISIKCIPSFHPPMKSTDDRGSKNKQLNDEPSDESNPLPGVGS